MAKAPETGMDVAEMKKLLIVSKREPVNCAIGIGKQGQALLLLHKTKSGMAVLADLKKDFPDIKNPGHGSALVDTDADAKLVVLTLNKAAGGIGRKLKKTLKGTGFSKVTIKNEDGSVAEAVGEEEEEESEADGQEAAATPPTEQTTTTAPEPADLGALKAELGTLIPKLVAASGGDPAKMDTLKQAAGAANAAIKNNDAAAAADAMAKLKDMMASDTSSSSIPVAPPTAPPVTPPVEIKPIDQGLFVKMQKSRLIWDSARKKVSGEIGSLKDAVRAEFAGDFEETKAIDALSQLDDILAQFDDQLLDALDDALSETDPAKHAAYVETARDVIDDYLAYYNSNELVQNLNGDTPFGTKLTIGATISATLKALQATLH